MIIGLDGSPMQGARTGAGWYLTHLVEALSHILEEDKVYVWMNNPSPEDKFRVPENRFLAVSPTHYPAAALKMTWGTLGTPTMDSLLGHPADAILYAGYPAPPHKHGRKAVFIQDLGYWANPRWATLALSKNYAKDMEKQAVQSDLILTCSEFNRQELLKLVPGLHELKVRVIPLGLAKAFQKPAPPDHVKTVRSKYQLTRSYVLTTGTLEPRKNLLRLVHAFLVFKQKVNSDHQLILAGSRGWIGEDFMEFIQAPAIADKVRWIDHVPQEDMPALYSGADLFVYPSLREGFGMPVLEAMGCGVPVICSNTGAMAEVVGDAAVQVDPTDVGAIANTMAGLVSDRRILDTLRQKGKGRASLYRWEDTAQQTLAALVRCATETVK